MWRTAKTLDEIKEDVSLNGNQNPVKLVIDLYHLDATCRRSTT